MNPQAMSDNLELAAWQLAEASTFEHEAERLLRKAAVKRREAAQLLGEVSAEFREGLMEAKEKRLERIISKL